MLNLTQPTLIFLGCHHLINFCFLYLAYAHEAKILFYPLYHFKKTATTVGDGYFVYTVKRPVAGFIWNILFLTWKVFLVTCMKGGEKEVRRRRGEEEKGKRGEEG